MSKSKISTMETQELIYRRRKRLWEIRKGKSWKQLLDEANR